MFTEITECRCCGEGDLYQYIDLSDQPLANSYHKKGEELPVFPLRANLCKKCFHTQLSVVVDPEIMFKHYLYVSGISKTLVKYFDDFAGWSMKWSGMDRVNRPVRVLDIACNDGSQLDGFKKLQTKHPVKTYGVDPAENLVPLAQAKGHNVLCKYWNKDTATVLPEKMDIIIAQNVFAHVHDALGFLEACKAAMHDASTLFIQTSQANIFRNGEFDTMYHEHLSFFTIKSMRTLCERAKLNLVRVEKTDIHGTSYVFIITKTGYHSPFAPYNVREMELEETGAWMYDIETYDKFAERALDCVTRLREYVDYYKRNGILVVGYGAAAKGMTVLNYGKIELDWIIDDTPIKQGLYTPGMNTRIYSAESLLHGEEMVFIPLAWNFYTEIRERVKAVRPNTKDIFIRYFPTFEIGIE
jgi:2-polyprenyl-3-methyl-5-hydroxy-6-metoxy-1,4-benzoquinol methylase